MERPIESLYDFRGTGHQPGFPFVAAALFILFVVMAAIGWVGGLHGGLFSATAGAGFATGALVPAIISLAIVASWIHSCRQAERDHYFDYLAVTEVSTLIAARASPEMDEASRQAITEFLNERHPGWSFGGSIDQCASDS